MYNNHVLMYLRVKHAQAKVNKRWTELSRTRRSLIQELDHALAAWMDC